VAQLRRGRDAREIRDLGEAKQVADQLASLEVTLSSRAGDGGRLFGSVTTADVVEAVAAAGGPKLDRRRLELPSAHIKNVGTHAVSVRLHPEVTASVTIEVTPA
jgi:large subunit ribosomal protein L9